MIGSKYPLVIKLPSASSRSRWRAGVCFLGGIMGNERFSITQSRAISDPRVSNAQYRTLAALGTFGDRDGWCFPKLQTLGKMLGKSRQAVSKDIQALVECGYVESHEQYRPDGSRRNNLYRLIFDTPPQPGVYTPQPGEQHPSTSEVDALTPHINDPYERMGEEEAPPQKPNAFKVYEQEIGAITPKIADRIKLALEDHPENWVIEAMNIASVNGKRSWAYAEAILKRWEVDGYGSEMKKANNGRSSKKNEPGAFEALRQLEQEGWFDGE